MIPSFRRSAPRRGPLGQRDVSNWRAPRISVAFPIPGVLHFQPTPVARKIRPILNYLACECIGVKKPPPGQRPLKTLERVLSKAGLGSRTEARKWIGAGRVKVNGKLIQTPDHWVDLGRDKVTLDNNLVKASEKIYLLLYKPTGYITTFKDPEGRPTVYDLISEVDSFVSPVGRLDLDTSGLLILTNDTQFAEHLTNPDHKVPKTYLVKCTGPITDDALEQLRKGVELSDGPTPPAAVNRVRDSGKYSHIEIKIS